MVCVAAHTVRLKFFIVMKYHISINQAQAAKICPDLDFNDLAIYDFIKSFATSGNCATIYDGGKV